MIDFLEISAYINNIMITKGEMKDHCGFDITVSAKWGEKKIYPWFRGTASKSKALLIGISFSKNIF